MNPEDKLYRDILNLTSKEEFDQFNRQNMVFITRFRPNLLLKRINDIDTEDPALLKNFDAFFVHDTEKIVNIQNTYLSRLTNNFSITDSLHLLDYFESLKADFPHESTQAPIAFAQYHVALGVMRQLGKPDHVKRADYMMFHNEIDNSVTQKLVNAVSQCVDINSSYDEQIITINFLVENRLAIQPDILQKVIRNPQQINEWLDVLIDKAQLNYLDKQIEHKKNQTSELELNANLNKHKQDLLHFVNEINQYHEQDYRQNLLTLLNNKHKRTQQNIENSVPLKHFSALMQELKVPLKMNEQFLYHMQEAVRQDIHNYPKHILKNEKATLNQDEPEQQVLNTSLKLK